MEEVNMARRKKKFGAVQFSRYDAADTLKSDEEMVAYLEAAIDEAQDAEDPGIIAVAVGDIARARGMMELSRQTGITREGLYKALSASGNPSFGTILKVMKALGLKLTPKRVEAQARGAKRRVA
jgi:probable addiction module antidote protein